MNPKPDIMKNYTAFFSLLVSILFLSCEGPQGPPGFDGLDGLPGRDGADGVNVTGNVIDIEGSFTNENDYRIFYEFPQSIEVFETDVVMVYLLWDQTEDGNGDAVDIWRALPQTVLLDQGILQYNFDHTFFDVNIFLDSDFDLGTLVPADTDNQVFRIAVIPAELTQTGKMDLSNIHTVMGRLGITEEEVLKDMVAP